jgi:hypothetical protein
MRFPTGFRNVAAGASVISLGSSCSRETQLPPQTPPSRLALAGTTWVFCGESKTSTVRFSDDGHVRLSISATGVVDLLLHPHEGYCPDLPGADAQRHVTLARSMGTLPVYEIRPIAGENNPMVASDCLAFGALNWRVRVRLVGCETTEPIGVKRRPHFRPGR